MNKVNTRFENEEYKFSSLKITDPTKEYLISILRIVNCMPLIQAVDSRNNELGFIRLLSFDPDKMMFEYVMSVDGVTKKMSGNESSMLSSVSKVINLGTVNIYIETKLAKQYDTLLSMAEQFDRNVIVGSKHYVFIDYLRKSDMYSAVMPSPDRYPRKWYFFNSNKSLLLFNDKGFDIIQGQTINKLLC